MTLIGILLVKHEHTAKAEWDYEFVEGDLVWTPSMILKFVTLSFIIGIFSSISGIGGGTFFNIVLMEYGVSPIVSTATGMYIAMFTNLSNSFLYAFSGVLIIEYSLWYGMFAAIGTFIGVKLINSYIDKGNKSYYN